MRVTYDPTEARANRARRRVAKPAGRLSGLEPWQRAALVISAGLLGVIALVSLVDTVASAGKVHPGVTVGGVKVGGMNPEAATAALERELPAKAKDPVKLTYKSKSWTVKPGDIKVSFDYASLVDQAMAVGRSGSAGTSLLQRLAAWTGSADLPAPVVADKTLQDGLLDKIANEVNVEPQDASVKIDGVETSVVPSSDGVAVNRPRVLADLLKAFSAQDRTVEVKTVVASVKITNEAAEQAKVIVDTMLAKPVKVTFKSRTWEFDAEEIAKLIAFRTVAATEASAAAQPAAGAQAPAGYRLEPYISADEASVTVPAKLGTGFGKPAVDAKFKTSNGSVTIVPSQAGVGPDIQALVADMGKVLTRDPSQDRVVVLVTNTSQPKLTTEAARQMGIVERISTFTTTYGSGNRPRVNNIHTLGDALDGTLIAPGKTFSFNGSVGERTAAKGYQEAGAIVNGKLVPQLGGGICQVGTTLFNAIFNSGLPVQERHNHSFYISHYPKGRDATVSWGGPDLKFTNDTENWVMISVAYSSSSITISLYGTDPGYEVASKTGPFTNEKPFGTETVKDPTLGSGIKVVEDGGVTGRTCIVTRTVTKSGKIIRTDNFKSVYRPKTQVVRVGTKPAGSSTSTSTR